MPDLRVSGTHDMPQNCMDFKLTIIGFTIFSRLFLKYLFLLSFLHLKTGSPLDSSPWTTEEQKLLEQALKTYPVNTPERWEKIAAAVPGRSKKDCMKRYKVKGPSPAPGTVTSSAPERILCFDCSMASQSQYLTQAK